MTREEFAAEILKMIGRRSDVSSASLIDDAPYVIGIELETGEEYFIEVQNA